MVSVTPMMELRKLAQAAYPINDDDWGSERQIEAENDFYNAVAALLPKAEMDDLEEYLICAKLTSDECIDEALSRATQAKRHPSRKP